MIFLVVDDLENNRFLLTIRLTNAGHMVISAGSGAEALAILQHRASWDHPPVGAVISDLVMPDMNGTQLCLAMRADPKLRNVPFLLYTMGYDALTPEDRAALAAAHAIIVLPPTFHVLLQAVKALAGT